MKNKLQFLLSGILIGIILSNGAAIAKSGTEMLEAFYSNIKIVIDGTEISPKDANGNAVEPFIHNGTTYLPVRAVGEALGKDVQWDGKTSTVYLTTPQKSEEKEPVTQEPEQSGQTETPNTQGEEQKEQEKTEAAEFLSTADYSISTNNVQKFLDFGSDEIKSGRLSINTTKGTKLVNLRAIAICYEDNREVRYELDMTEPVSMSDTEIKGYFRAEKDNTVIYEKLLGTVSISESGVSIHTEKTDFNVYADKKNKPIYMNVENTMGFAVQAKSLNDKTASGIFSIDFQDEENEASTRGAITVGTDKYDIKLTKLTSLTENALEGFFEITKNGEVIEEDVFGTFHDLKTPLGEYLKFTMDNGYIFDLQLVEILLKN